ncbi:MAG: nicotinate-nucleotide adenylyltransferase [Gammaproteobacteria bacterium]|nr:nicotinate-nucleotide adenylyltransferase [Gammaproteobacteria bacterium]
MTPIGILGGTFDPVHYGHLRTAMELRECLGFAEVRFVPCRIPPHDKAPVAPVDLRVAMLAAAIEDTAGFFIDDRELHREGPSYSVDTLTSMRQDLPDRPLCLIVGMDAFAGLTSWHRWQELLSLAHIIVAHRPGAASLYDDALQALLDRRRSCDPADLGREPFGRILLHSVTQLDISSSAIREGVARGESQNFLLPDRVVEMIESSGCYAEAARRSVHK